MLLAQFVREARWDELETAWTEHILAEAALAPALEAIAVAAARKEIPRCLPLVREHAEVLAGSGRAADAAELLGQTMLLGGSPGELAKLLLQSAENAWSAEPFWPVYIEIADLRENAPDMRAAWRSFRKLRSLEPGRVVYHAAGWGLGGIESVELETRGVTVRFTSGRTDRFPLQSAVAIFEVLEPGDLRCLVVQNPAELDRLLKKEPLEVLRWVLARNDGKATQAAVKLAMGTLGIDGPRFSGWWRKAQKEAESSEWFEITGPPNRALVRMLDRAEDPSVGLRRQLLRSRDLGEALSRIKTIFVGGTVGEGVRATALDVLEQLTADSGHKLSQRVAAWLFLREQRGETPAELRALVDAALRAPAPRESSQPSPLWTLFQQVPGLREQERCVEVLQETLGEGWLDEVSRSLRHAAPGMVRGLVEAMEAAGRQDELVQHYSALLARPTMNPVLLVRLAERVELSPLAARLGPPEPRAQTLLQLAVYLQRASIANPTLARTRARLTSLLVEGSPPLLRRLLAGADLDSLRALASLLEGGVDRPLDRLFTQIAVEFSPDVFRSEEREFWETPNQWTTRAGLKKRQEELRILRDVKIPENAEAIGRAASYGDLSENSEWEAAIEDQRNLTNRAMELETEIEDARLIENAMVPEGRVAPGTRVSFLELDSGETRVFDILGPWDADGERVVSYRSPLAKGMLGRSVGDEVVLQLPSSQLPVRILTIEPLVL